MNKLILTSGILFLGLISFVFYVSKSEMETTQPTDTSKELDWGGRERWIEQFPFKKTAAADKESFDLTKYLAIKNQLMRIIVRLS